MPNEVEITITATDLTGPAFSSVMRKMAALKAEAKALSDQIADVGNITVNEWDVTSSLIALKSKIQSLGIADLADVNVTPGRLLTQLNLLKRLINQSGIADLLGVNLNQSALSAQLARIASSSERIPVDFSIGKMPIIPTVGPTETLGSKFGLGSGVSAATLASWAKMNTELALANSETQTFRLHSGPDLDMLVKALGDAWAYAGAKAQMFLDVLNTKLNPYIVGAGIVFDRFKGSIGGLASSIASSMLSVASSFTKGGLGGVTWFGGWNKSMAVTIPLLGTVIHSVTAWHVVLDGVLEATIAIGSALLTAAVGLVAMSPAAKDILLNFKSMQTVSSALGVNFGIMNGKFQNLAQSLAPNVIEIYGGAINALNRNTGILGQTAHQVADVFDTWVAKIGIWANSQAITGKLFATGLGFMNQFASIVGNVANGIAHLVKSDPGTAHFLLDIVNAAAGAFNWFSQLPGPIVKTVLALHSIVVWGPLIIGALTQIIGYLGKSIVQLAALLANPLVDLAILAAAFAYAGYEATQASGPIKKFIGDINNGLQGLNASNAILQIAVDIGQVGAKMSDTTGLMAQESKTWNNLGNTFRSFGYDTRASFDEFGKAIGQLTGGHFVSGLKSWWNSIVDIFKPGAGKSIAITNDIKALNSELNSLFGKQATLFQTAGQLMKGNDIAGQVYSYSQALALMDMAGVQAGDSLEVMKAKVNNLITGYKNLTGGGAALTASIQAVDFATLQQQSQVAQLNSGWDAFENTIQGGESGLVTFAKDLDTITANAKASHAIMGGLSGTSNALTQSFQQGLADAETYADKLTLLASASGGGATATALLNKSIMDMVALLLPAAKNSQTLTAELYALAQRGGYTGADSFKALSQWAGSSKGALNDLNNITTTLTVSAGNLVTDVQQLSTALGTTLNTAIATAIFNASGGQKTFDAFATAILQFGPATPQAQTAALNLGKSLYDLTGNVSKAHDEFMTFANVALKLTKSQAETLWQQTLPSLQNYINNLHGKNIAINATLSGAGGVTITSTSDISDIIRLYGTGTGGLAHGGLIPGYGGGDRWPALLESGEAVIDKDRTRQLSWLFRAMGVPGFAGGGLAGHPVFSIANWMLGSAAGSLGGILMGKVNRDVIDQYNRIFAAEVARTRHNAKGGSWSVQTIGASAGGLVGSAKFDNGGWLKPGWTQAYNGTGSPEWVGGGGPSFSIEVTGSGNRTFDALMRKWMRENVRVRGGGSSQQAWGRH